MCCSARAASGERELSPAGAAVRCGVRQWRVAAARRSPAGSTNAAVKAPALASSSSGQRTVGGDGVTWLESIYGILIARALQRSHKSLPAIRINGNFVKLFGQTNAIPVRTLLRPLNVRKHPDLGQCNRHYPPMSSCENIISDSARSKSPAINFRIILL